MADGDAVDFILQQHTQIRELFARLSDGSTARQDTFDALLRLLAVHETAEEEVIYPVVRLSVPDGNAIVSARQAEEDEAKKALSDLESLGVDAPEFTSQFEPFRKMVEAHAASEEQEVLPQLREHVSATQLGLMRKALVAAEAFAPTHPHKNAPESAIGNLATGPVIALMDRVRDAVRAATARDGG